MDSYSEMPLQLTHSEKQNYTEMVTGENANKSCKTICFHDSEDLLASTAVCMPVIMQNTINAS
jgi:hypothetical protein